MQRFEELQFGYPWSGMRVNMLITDLL